MTGYIAHLLRFCLHARPHGCVTRRWHCKRQKTQTVTACVFHFLSNPFLELHTFLENKGTVLKETNKILNRCKDRCLCSFSCCMFCCFCSCFTCCTALRGTFPMWLWYGVVSMTAPGMTTQDALHSQIETLEHSMFAKCLEGILRTCGSESAAWGLKR
jgi:hypothetical protein